MMTRILKFLTIIILLTCSAFGAPKDNATQLQIRLHDTKGKAVPGILVYTENMKDGVNPKKTTDSEGWVVFDNCRSFFLNSTDRQSGKQHVKIHFDDPENVYKHYAFTMDPEWGADCKMGFVLSIADNATYATPEQMQTLAVTRGLNLRYFPACKPDFTNYPSNVKHQCITEFKDTKVQMLEAEMLARIYLEKTYPNSNINIQCQPKYETRNGSDYLQCTSTDAKRAFEFKFRNLNTKPKLQNAQASNIELNTAEALCNIHKGKYQYHSNVYPLCYKEDDVEGTKTMCRELNSDAINFGWSTAYKPWGLITTCGFEFGAQDAQTFEPRSYGSIDPYAFQHIEVQSTQDLILLLNQYVRFKTLDELDGFWCDSAPTRVVKDNKWSLDFDWNYQNVLTCHMNTKNGELHDLDFVFKNMNQSNRTKNAGDMAGMECIAGGGNFDGKNCSAIGKQQCLALNLQLPGGTVFDEKLGLCTMRDSIEAEHLRKLERVAKIAGGVVVGILITIESGGTGAKLVIAWVLTTISTASTIALEILNNIKNERARDFLASSQLCPYSTTCTANGCSTNCRPDSICAKNTLLNAYADISSMVTGQDSADQLSQAVSYATETLVEKIGHDCIDEDYKTALKTATNDLEIASRAIQTTSDIIDTVWFIQKRGSPIKSGIIMKFRNTAAAAIFSELFGGNASDTNIASFVPTGSLTRLGQGVFNTLTPASTSTGSEILQDIIQSPTTRYIDRNIVHPENELPDYINDL